MSAHCFTPLKLNILITLWWFKMYLQAVSVAKPFIGFAISLGRQKYEVYRHQKHIRLLLFNVHMGSVCHGWIGCLSAVKSHAITNCVTGWSKISLSSPLSPLPEMITFDHVFRNAPQIFPPCLSGHKRADIRQVYCWKMPVWQFLHDEIASAAETPAEIRAYYLTCEEHFYLDLP
jgi:hypothetical protein